MGMNTFRVHCGKRSSKVLDIIPSRKKRINMVNLSSLVAFVAVVGETTVLAFPRVSMKPVMGIVNGVNKRVLEETVSGLSTWDTEGKTEHDHIVKKVKQFGEFYDANTMVREEVSEKPDGMIQVLAIYRMKDVPAATVESVKGAKVVK